MVPLDIFKEISHNVLNKLEAWLYFIGSDSPKDISRVIEAFPEFKELYGELLMLRYRTEELVSMFDVIKEALRAADEGTVKYMVEEQQKEIEEQQKEIEERKKKIAEQQQKLVEQKREIAEQQKEIAELKNLLKQANIETE